MFDHEKSHVLHVRPIVVNHHPSRFGSRIEMLMPGKHRDAQCIALFPIYALVRDDRVTATGDYILRFFIAVPVGA